jgi:glycerol-3-phosphate acyltransferase PlsY
MNSSGIIGVMASYVIGSFPSAYLAGRFLKGVDLRTVGSGNLGTANVYRSLGTAPAVVVLIADMLKGAVPTLAFPGLLAAGISSETSVQLWGIAFGASAIIGHWKPVFLLWRGGGKGVATAAGVFLALSPGPTSLCVLAFIGVVAATRLVSLASIVGAALLPVLEWLNSGPSPIFYASVGVALFVTWAHRANIRRIRAGTEPRIRRPEGDRA